jgi:NTP pyrophosphatase (non-canonical NTP hydrolase)
VLDHATKLGEAIRREDADLILRETAETANWLFGFVAKLHDEKTGWESRFNIPIEFSHMIWHKYPNICPHCFQRVYITRGGQKATSFVGDLKGKCKYCLANYPKVEKRTNEPEYKELKQSSDRELRNYAQENLEEIPKSLKEMEAMFHRIYEANTALSTLEKIGFHILEEAGEMGRAVIDIYTAKSPDKTLEDKQYDLCDETAEVFAWLCSLTLRVRDQANNFDKYGSSLLSLVLPTRKNEQLSDLVGLEQILWVIHRNKETKRYQCDYCGFATCKCELEFAWEQNKN